MPSCFTAPSPLRSNFKLLAVQGKMYAVGGQSLGTVECYSPEQDWWTCVSSMPDPLAEFSACECQGMIYVMGGYTARGERKSVSGHTFRQSVTAQCKLLHIKGNGNDNLAIRTTSSVASTCSFLRFLAVAKLFINC